METLQDSRTRKIRALNNHSRTTFTGARIMLTRNVVELDPELRAKVLEAVRTFDDFNDGNDPHHEADMAFFEVEGEKYFFKHDLYEEPDVKSANGEPVVTRVLTIMLAEEY